MRQIQTADLQTYRLAVLQTCRHADSTYDLSQFILKIILCNLRHSISCAVRLVRFDTWLLARLSFRNKIRTCASFEKTLSNYIANSIIRARSRQKYNFSDFFYFLKHQDRVNSPTNEACWIELIGYRTPGKNKLAAQRYSKDINKAFPTFGWLSRYPSSKLE